MSWSEKKNTQGLRVGEYVEFFPHHFYCDHNIQKKLGAKKRGKNTFGLFVFERN